MRNQQRLWIVIFGVIFLGILLFFVSLVIRLVFNDPNALPAPVISTAIVILREKETTTRPENVNGTSTPRTTTIYRLTGEYLDGSVTRRGIYTVSEDVYYSHEEGSTLDIYYYPGRKLSAYGKPSNRSIVSSKPIGMTHVIGVFMLAVAGIMAFGFIGGILMPAFTKPKRSLPRRTLPPTAEDLRERFGDLPADDK